MTEFISWETLGTYAGALAMVVVITQFTKDLGFVKKIPTQLLSYFFALVVLVLAHVFTGEFTVDILAQSALNAVIISIAANGAHAGILKIAGKTTDGDFLVDTSNPDKDIYRLDLGKALEVLGTKKTITLAVKPEQGLSQK